MIYIYMRGRLGNQLFQYAFVRALQEKNPGIKVLYNFDEINSMGKKEDGWENSLKYFNVKEMKEMDNGNKPKLSVAKKIILKIYWKNFPHGQSIEKINEYQLRYIKLLNKFGLYYLDLGFFPFNTKIRKNVIISGNFESEKYFDHIRAQLLKEITPKYDLLDKNKDLFNKIKDTNSVCVSIRRGDFLNNDNSKLLNICDSNYFYKSIDEIKKRIEHPTLFFFSDDIDWVKKNIKVDLPCYYETGDDPIWEKLRLMYTCKNFVLSNSSFSWWAQYLCQNEKKIVIAPKKWNNSSLPYELLNFKWILVDTD